MPNKGEKAEWFVYEPVCFSCIIPQSYRALKCAFHKASMNILCASVSAATLPINHSANAVSSSLVVWVVYPHLDIQQEIRAGIRTHGRSEPPVECRRLALVFRMIRGAWILVIHIFAAASQSKSGLPNHPKF